jgi:hypothetical protein
MLMESICGYRRRPDKHPGRGLRRSPGRTLVSVAAAAILIFSGIACSAHAAGRSPAVSGLRVSGNGRTLRVTARVSTRGLPTTCRVTVSGTPVRHHGRCGALSVAVAMYDTSYRVTFSATNSGGTSTVTGTGRSGLKVLTANATTAFGLCKGTKPARYCGGSSHMEPTPDFVANNGAPLVAQGTQEMAGCWTTGGADDGIVAPYTSGSNVWVYMPGQGYMSILWFPDPGSVTAGLPQASSC